MSRWRPAVALVALLLAACGVVPTDVDPRGVEAAIRADPQVAAVRSSYLPAGVGNRARLTLDVDLRPGPGADAAVSRAAAELLGADGFDEISWTVAFRLPEEQGVLQVDGAGGDGSLLPVVESEARRWTGLADSHPAASVTLVLVEDGLWRGGTSLDVADHESVIAAFADVAASSPAPALEGHAVGVGTPDGARYSSDGPGPSEEVVAAVRNVMGIADPAPAGLGVERSVAWRYVTGADPYVDVQVDLRPDEYRQVPGDQVLAMIPGTRTDRIAREFEQVLDGSGSRFRLLVQIFGYEVYLARDTR